MRRRVWGIFVRLCLYNPLVSQTTERAAEVSAELRDCSIILLPDTCRRASPYHPVSAHSLPHHKENSWDWSKQEDKAAGISIMISTHLAQPSIVRQILHSPPQLQGRVAGVRLRARQLDLLALALYVPTRMAATAIRRSVAK